jgi:hypothetical protein
MTSWWPWLAAVGAGALHGLNPANGWVLAAARGVRARDSAQALRALLPLALGHATSVALVAGAVALGLALDRTVLEVGSGALLLVAVAVHLWRRAAPRLRAPAGGAALALWSFIVSSAHGAGWMLVPALMPLCVGGDASIHQGTVAIALPTALAAVAVHSAAMLAVAAGLAASVCGGAAAIRRRFCGGQGNGGRSTAAPRCPRR